MTEQQFQYDVFLSHSAKDKDVVRGIAERLKSDGVRVWGFEQKDEGGRLKDELAELQELLPSSFHLHPSVEDGLEHSRVLVLCMSAEAIAADWLQLESHTFRFKDPLNQNRRFIPLKLDDAPTKGSLAQFSYIDWRPDNRENEYPKLLEACWLSERSDRQQTFDAPVEVENIRFRVFYNSAIQSEIKCLAFRQECKEVLYVDWRVRSVEIETGRQTGVLDSPSADFFSLSPDQNLVLSAHAKGSNAIHLLDLSNKKE